MITSETEHSVPTIEQLVDRYDPAMFDLNRAEARLRVEGFGGEPRDVVIHDGKARLEAPHGEPDAELIADQDTWNSIVEDRRGGMAAVRAGRLRVRRDLHLGVGFLAATAGAGVAGQLRIRSVETAAGSISTI